MMSQMFVLTLHYHHHHSSLVLCPGVVQVVVEVVVVVVVVRSQCEGEGTLALLRQINRKPGCGQSRQDWEQLVWLGAHSHYTMVTV